jgi:hypothetical protein
VLLERTAEGHQLRLTTVNRRFQSLNRLGAMLAVSCPVLIAGLSPAFLADGVTLSELLGALRCSDTELLQMVIKVAITEDSPLSPAQSAPIWVNRPRSLRVRFHELIDQFSQRCKVIGPRSGLGEKRLGRSLDPPPRPRQKVEKRLAQTWDTRRAGQGTARVVVEGHAHLIAEMGKHARRAHSAPERSP